MIKVDSVNRGIYATVTIPVDLVTYPEGDYLLRVYMTSEGLTVNKAVTDTFACASGPKAKFLLEGKEFVKGDWSARQTVICCSPPPTRPNTPPHLNTFIAGPMPPIAITARKSA